ncbi:Thymosin beta-a [Apis cerana cerana]|uniref:Thymosin beta-a n=1 Tax=Apis cerana cerana TaxID=94128 RepID=A0A2A3EL66_APICC|nr:Thymosin beta-a [Apis cerana cerana]
MSSPSLKDLPKVALDLKSELEGFNHGCMKKASTAEKNVLPSAEDVRQERQHSELIHDVETFKPDQLKHADTKEKIILPNAKGSTSSLAGNKRRVFCCFWCFEVTETYVTKPSLFTFAFSLEEIVLHVQLFCQQFRTLYYDNTQCYCPLNVAAEKTQQTLMSGIETFDPSSLKHTETQEKNLLPDMDAIQQEKGKQQLISGIENFDPAKLKHAETLEKNPLPTKEGKCIYII